MFALVDCNNFYCSCERLFHPNLKGKPVIVLSNNDGCAIARSEEAKVLGIEMGAPYHMIQSLIKKHGIAVFSSNYTLYGDMSRRVMQTLKQFAPRMEEYSIDEAFLDLSNLPYHNLTKLAKDMKAIVYKVTGIPVSIGIAPTKTLAKMANRYAKKTKPQIGVHAACNDILIKQMLEYTEVGDICGIGSQNEKKLRAQGIETAFDVLQMNDEWMRKEMSVVGQRLLNELKGVSCIPLEDTPPVKKNICTSRSFGKLLSDYDDIKIAVSNYASRCAFKLRKEKSCTSAVHVFIQTNSFRKQDPQYSNSLTIPLKTATNNTQEIIFYALCALKAIYKPAYNYMKAGVIVHNIVPEQQVQQGLFDTRDRTKEHEVNETVDAINKSWGREILQYGIMSMNEKWKMNRAYLSQCYTTRLDQVLTVRI